MYLVGSRLLGIENECSDWDYIELDLPEDNERSCVNKVFELTPHKHCYHMKVSYAIQLNKYEINDFNCLYNVVNYRTGAFSLNPFDYKDKWISFIKDAAENHRWKMVTVDEYKKSFYYLAFNLECLRQNTLYPTMDLIKKFHDKTATEEEYQQVLEEIKNL